MLTARELQNLAARYENTPSMEDILRNQSQHRRIRPAARKPLPPEDALRTMADILARQARIRRLASRYRKPQVWPAYICR